MPTRVRTKPQMELIPLASETTIDSVGNATIVYGPATSSYSSTEEMVDVVTENYFERRRLGEILPVNPMVHSKLHVSRGDGAPLGDTWSTAYFYRGNPWMQRIYGNVSAFWCDGFGSSKLSAYGPGNFATSDYPEAPSLAYMLQEARAKAHGNAVDLTTMLAELDKSVDLVRNTHTRALQRARRVIDAAVKLRKGDLDPQWRRLNTVSKVADLLNIASQIWLEYRFGWRLLVKDIESIKELYDHVGHTFDVAYERGTFQLELEGPKSIIRHNANCTSFAGGQSTGTLWGYYDYDEYRVIRRSIRVGAMVKYRGDRPYFGDPLVTAWELVPLSWVADMFVNVGSALRAWSPMIIGEPVHQWMTDDVQYLHGRELTPRGSYGSWPNTYGWVGANPVLTAEVGSATKSRSSVNMQLPNISFNPGIPKIAKLADLAAVVGQFGNRVVQMATKSVKTDLQWFR